MSSRASLHSVRKRYAIGHLRALLLVLCLITVTVTAASSPYASGHFAGHIKASKGIKVLVVPLEFKEPYCPDKSDMAYDCPDKLPVGDPAKGVMYADLVKGVRNNADYYQPVLNKEVNTYYDRATYSQISFEFHVLAKPKFSFSFKEPAITFDPFGNGWWTSPTTLQEFCKMKLVKGTFQCTGEKDMGDVIRLNALQIAENALGLDGLKQYKVVVGLVNFSSGGAQALPGMTYKGQAFLGISVCEYKSDWSLVTFLAHELGHSVGLPDLYYNQQLYGKPGMGAWDIMDDHGLLNHFSTWSKRHVGWIDDDVVVNVMPPGKGKKETTIQLGPQELASSKTKIVRVSLTNTLEPFLGYYLECRRKLNGDNNIPGEGVLVARVYDKPSPPDVSAVALLKPGDEFVKAKEGIKISYTSASGDACEVKVERQSSFNPDLEVAKVFVDSKKNGVQATLPTEDDPFWKGHPNRIWYEIRNVGQDPSGKFSVRIYVMQPITVDCKATKPTIGTLIDEISHVSLPPYTHPQLVAVGYTDKWIPMSDESAKIIVEVDAVEGDGNPYNNLKEITSFSLEPGAQMVDKFTVTNTGCEEPTKYVVQTYSPCASPADCWIALAEPASFAVERGDTKIVRIKVMPPQSARPGDIAEISIALVQDIGVGTFGHLVQVFELKLSMPVRDQTAVTCNSPEKPISVGSAVVISGAITPAHADSRVALEYRSPSGRTIIQVVPTDAQGAYRDSFVHDESGEWTVQVHWQGDVDHQPATASCSFSLAPPAPSPLPIPLVPVPTVPVEPRPQPPTPPPVRPVFDFSVSASPTSQAVSPGGSASYRIAVTLVSGSAQPVSLTVAGVPVGASASFSPDAGNPSFTTALTIVTTPRTPPGTYSLTISATGGGIARSATVMLIIAVGR